MNNKATQAVAADHIFDGVTMRHDAAVLIEGENIVGNVSLDQIPRGAPVQTLPSGAWLAPGFIDVQVNGGGDVLFNDSPTPEAVATIARAHRRFGTTGLLPTFITDAAGKMPAAIEAVQIAMDREPSVLGIHLEGPFISPERPGVHETKFIRKITPADIALLTKPRKGVTLITLAPEQMPKGAIAQLAKAGVRISLGHSIASYEQTRAAMSEGLTGFTHLFNAMPQMLSRQPGPVAAALESPDAFYGLIVDGEHVDPASLRIAVRGLGRPMLVTDAMPPVGGSRATFALYGNEIAVSGGLLRRKDGTLAGAFLTMAQAVNNCVHMLGLRLEDALPLASRNPADFLGLGSRLGQLAAGYRADMVAFHPERIDVIETWVAGKASR
ncbi:MAG TPA: N-acetylglucosamine-6-phosphate deacetylase [Xanthobacteraceae bacterium]|nr:N-acetylglucosamine-6-phosphate deacetylase [Xanthobacteraceae bacterium]